ncbi:VOC family protein [Candidatus Nitrosocosmicus arcticus]|uniref:Glyoxalase/bleomycin resistance domain protein n=1 Tax=Candidatus Nitrosocosmicus arcticus TaxID=2035267 RepID=A0A557SWB4_9ARCH|nr:VOC family protein [Candidatus Nitrosocosmicus arcticus]TVP40890.1 glyoxalase/bleomycin resistance domain protein [Candidatus Nitrosocosmicus arcticus]
MERVNPIPDGYHTVTPYLIIPGASKLIDFLKQAFNANELERMEHEGAIMHAVVQIGDSRIMLSDSNKQWKPLPCMLHLYVNDVDKIYQEAIKAAAVSLREPTDEFYGDRTARVSDFSGNQWWIATHKKDISKEKLARLAEDHMRNMETKK